MQIKLSIGKTSLNAELKKEDAQKLLRELFNELDSTPAKPRRGRTKTGKSAVKKPAVGAKKRGRPAKVKVDAPKAATVKKPRTARKAKAPVEQSKV